MIKCSICGTENHNDADFCDGCGVELEKIAPAAPVVPEPQPIPEPQIPQAASIPEPELHPETIDPVLSMNAEDFKNQGADPFKDPFATAQSSESVFTGNFQQPSSPAITREEPEETNNDDGYIPPAHLTIKKFGAVSGEAIPMASLSMIVGRFDASTGPVDVDVTGLPGAEHVSRRHAQFYVERSTWKIRDLGSTNGVFIRHAGDVNFSPRIQEPVSLHSGDEVALGNLVMVFQKE